MICSFTPRIERFICDTKPPTNFLLCALIPTQFFKLSLIDLFPWPCHCLTSSIKKASTQIREGIQKAPRRTLKSHNSIIPH